MKRSHEILHDELPTQKFLKYEKSKMTEVAHVEELYMKTKQVKYEHIFSVTSLLADKTCKRGIEEVAQLTTLETFRNVGNTLGIELSSQYFIPVILDLDHKTCEKNHDCCIDQLNLNNTILDITTRISFFLHRPKIEVYTEFRNCGVHIYVSNIIVSIFVYEQLLDYLNSTGNFEYFIDDNLTRLPFPNQVKLNKTVYTPRTNNTKSKWKMDKIRILDYKYEITYQPQIDRVELCRFENALENVQWNNIIESNRLEEKIITTDSPIDEVKNPPAFLTRLFKRKIITKFRMFGAFFEAHQQRSHNFDDISIKSDIDEIIEDMQILKVLSRLGQLVAMQFGINANPQLSQTTKFIGILIEAVDEPSFEIYAICAIIEYIKRSVVTVTYEDAFDACFLVFNLFTPPVDLVILSKLRNHIANLIAEVCGDFNPEYILQYIIAFKYYEISSRDSLSNVIQKVLNLEIDDTCNEDTIKKKLEHIIFPFFYPCVQTTPTVEEFQFFNLKYYQRKIFIPGKRGTVSSNNTEVPLYLLVHTNKLIKKGEIVNRSFLEYLSKIPTVNMKAGLYKYFINTNLGVFCNLTGTYSRHVPFLYFKQKQMKSFVLYPNTDLFDPFSCTRYLNANMMTFETAIKSINLFWFNDILVKGLMSLDSLQLSEHNINRLLNDLKERLCNTSSSDTNKAHISRIYEPVYQRYKIIDKTTGDEIKFDNENIYKHVEILISKPEQYDIIQIPFDYSYKLLYEFEDDLLTHTFGYILQLFLYDELTIIEILRQFCLLNQPKNQFRRFLLLFGSTGTGKTVFMNNLSDFHGSSSCSIMSKLTFNGGCENHSSLVLNAATSYLTIIKEASLVDRNILKNLSGNDPIQLRSIFQDFQTIEPISFIVCVANEFPRIIGADNAIRDRLGCFNFPCSFKNDIQSTNILDNYINMEALRTDSHPNLSRGISNILYMMYYYHISNEITLKPTITNKDSVTLLNDFMIANNFVHEYLAAAKITESHGNMIAEKDFKLSIKRAIRERGHKITFENFIYTFNTLYPRAHSIPDKKICGFKFTSGEVFVSKNLIVVKTCNKKDTISEEDVSKILQADTTLTSTQRQQDFLAFKRHFTFHRQGSSKIYIGLKCITPK